ncbi:MAG: PolC-type DNA polymerase III N-terminal domain-containing protein, partial [Bacillota bacterium]|nr:PolC-type DNA polymerase III N-terminal domain-containing protein [Bacillota bacterium]
MNDSDSAKKQQFQLLLQQLHLTDDAIVNHFQYAQLEKVTIEKKARKWHFRFLFEKIVPSAVYGLFTAQLEKTFSYLANISYTIQVADQSFHETVALDYWKRCVQEIDGISPPILKLLNEQTPKIQGTKLILNVRNETEGMTIKQKYSGMIVSIYQSFGFPYFAIETEVQDSAVENGDYEKFMKAKQKEDQERALLAMVEMQKRESEKDSQSGAESNGPLTIGLTIKDNADYRQLIEIVDEERRVAIEGYIFFAETRDLRSGRTLLTFKVTDYTSSIMVKMFSRDKEDAALYQRVQKGMWVKVRGSIQNDTFVRDLVMIGNDINEIKPVQRKDTAPENEKRVELHLHTPMSQMDAVTPTAALVAQAKKWGHKAIAITDHAVAQSFP